MSWPIDCSRCCSHLRQFSQTGVNRDTFRAASRMEKPNQNNLMTMSNVLFRKRVPAQYTSVVRTRVSNSLLVGEAYLLEHG